MKNQNADSVDVGEIDAALYRRGVAKNRSPRRLSAAVLLSMLPAATAHAGITNPETIRRIYWDWPSSLTVAPRPAYEPSAQSDITISMAVTELGSATIGAVPLRRLPNASPAWGLQGQLGFDGINSSMLAGVGYRFDPRWIFHARYAAEADRLGADTASGRRRLHFGAIALLPALTLAYEMGVAVAPSLISNDAKPSVHLVRGNLSWRLGVYFEMEVTAAETWRRRQPALPFSETVSASISMLAILPWLVGTKPYDEVFLNTGIQRGIAIGLAALVERCAQRDDPRRLCGTVLDEAALEWVLEIRLVPGIRPRLQIGPRHSHRIDAAGHDVDANGLDLSIQLGLVL